MFTSVWSVFGWREEPEPEPETETEPVPPPPPVTIIGVRIPADGTPAHLLPLTTISDSSATSGFLFHVPDLRYYWTSDNAWRLRDLHRLDLLQDNHVPLSHYLRQKDDLKKLLRFSPGPNREQMLHLRQRYLLPQRHMVVQPQHHSCLGAYYVFYSFAVDDLPINQFVPRWIGDKNDTNYYGDAFLVKISPHEYGEDGRAAYEDMVPEFLDLLAEGPLNGQ